MSALVIGGDVSGTVTLQAPSAAGTTILTLPSTSGTIITTAGGTATNATNAVNATNATNATNAVNATNATNVAGGVAGNVPYQTGAGATSFVTNGTAGQVLTSAGAAAPTWNTLVVSGSGGTTASGSVTLTSASSGAQSVTPTTYGQIVTLPDATTMTEAACVFNIRNAGGYSLKLQDSAGTILGFIFPLTSVVVGLADNSTAAGAWTADNLEPVAITANLYATGVTSFGSGLQVLVLDANRYMILFGNATFNLYAVVYDQSTQTFGSTTLVRSGGSNFTVSLSATNQVLVVSTNNSTAMEAVVLSVSSTTITVNTAATKTLASASLTWYPPKNNIIQVGSTYIATYFVSASTNKAIAFTISGTTVTIGSETTLNGNTAEYTQAFSVSSTVAIIFTFSNGGAIQCSPYTVSGTTLTIGTQVNITVSGSASNYRLATVNAGSRWALFYGNAAGSLSVSLVSISGSTVSASTVVVLTSPYDFGTVSYGEMIVSGNKVIVSSQNSSNYPMFNVVTDTSGTATAGTQVIPGQISIAAGSLIFALASNNKAVSTVNSSNNARSIVLDYSGSSLVASGLTVTSTAVQNLYPSNWNSTKREFNLYGASFAYSAPSSTVGYRSVVMSQTGFAAMIFKQTTLSGGNVDYAINSDLWYLANNGTSYILQRLECATI